MKGGLVFSRAKLSVTVAVFAVGDRRGFGSRWQCIYDSAMGCGLAGWKRHEDESFIAWKLVMEEF